MSSPGDSHESEFTYRAVVWHFNQHQTHRKYLLNHTSLHPRPRGSDSVGLGSGLRPYIINKLPGVTEAVSQETTFSEPILYKYQNSSLKNMTFYRGPEGCVDKARAGKWGGLRGWRMACEEAQVKKVHLRNWKRSLMFGTQRMVLRVFRDTVEVVSSQQILNGIENHIKEIVLHPPANGNLLKDFK